MIFSSWTSIAGIGALIAAASAGWSYFRNIARWASDLLVCRTAVTDEAAEALLAYCWTRGRRSPFGMRSFGGVVSWVQPKARNQLVAFENITSDPVLFWFGRAPLVIHRMDGRDSSNAGANNGSNATMFISSIRGTINLDDLMGLAVDHYNHVKQGTNGESKRRRFFTRRLGGSHREREDSQRANSVDAPVGHNPNSNIQEKLTQKTLRLLQWRPEDLIAVTPDRSPFHGYAFPPEVMNAMGEMKLWLENEKWFRAKSVPWRRGWLLHGPPGCGKSTLTRAMAMHFDMPVFSIDLSTHSNDSFVNAWQELSSSTPAIALIEDIDAVFKGRDNIAAKNTTRDALTFDCLLNCISGVGNSEGVFLVVTTNHPGTLDPALGVVEEGRSSRPGRIDRVIELGYMQEAERATLARHILSDFPNEIISATSNGHGMTPAQFQDHCAQIALRKFWEKNK